MSSTRVWAVRGQYNDGFPRPKTASVAIEHKTLDAALVDVEYLWNAGFGSSMRSYVVPA